MRPKSEPRTWLKRYVAGEHVLIWDDIAALEEDVRNAAYLPYARAVAAEMMRRVRLDIEALIARWTERGFRFGYGWADQWARELVAKAPPLLAGPCADDVERFETTVGPLPLSLSAFYETVGAVNFVGAIPDGWPGKQELDPLQVELLAPQLEGEGAIPPQGGELVICPDGLLKYFYGGVGPMTIHVPDSSADACLRFEDEYLGWRGAPLMFVRYLREIILNRGGIGITESHESLSRELAEDLTPF